MTLRSYLWGMRISAFLSLVAWGLVIKFIDPLNSGLIGQLLFYVSTFLLLSGIFILFFTWSRRRLGGGEEIAFAYLGTSFRQGILLSILAICLLALQSFRILTWWDALLVVAGIFLIELHYLTKK